MLFTQTTWNIYFLRFLLILLLYKYILSLHFFLLFTYCNWVSFYKALTVAFVKRLIELFVENLYRLLILWLEFISKNSRSFLWSSCISKYSFWASTSRSIWSITKYSRSNFSFKRTRIRWSLRSVISSNVRILFKYFFSSRMLSWRGVENCWAESNINMTIKIIGKFYLSFIVSKVLWQSLNIDVSFLYWWLLERYFLLIFIVDGSHSYYSCFSIRF